MADILDEYGIDVPQQKTSSPDVMDEYGVDARPNYISRPAETYGGNERLLLSKNGEVVDAPFGSSKVLEGVLQDDAFDFVTPEPSTTAEETIASFEKQGAMAAWVAGSFGMVSQDEVSQFIADRSTALKNAQSRAPDYMKTFNERWEKANGIFEGLGVVMDSPRAFGRMAITQTPNALFPIITGWAGAQSGAMLGGAFGSAVPVAGTTAGAITGGIVGGAVGSFPGSAFTEVGSQIDELVTEAGYDPTDANSIREAFNNQELMDTIKEKALKKGLTTAAVDAVFQVVGGKITKKVFSSAGEGIAKKAGAVATDIGIQSSGEFSGEAAGQYARDGRVDWKDAMLEGLTSVGQSMAQTGLGYAYRGGKESATSASKEGQKPSSEAENVVKDVQEASVAETKAQDIAETQIDGVPQEVVSGIVNDFLNGVEPDTSQYSEAQADAIQNVLDKAAPVREKIISGRIRNLDIAVESKLEQVDAAEAELKLAQDEGRGTKGLEDRAEKLAKEWEALDAERGELLTIENPLSESADLLEKDITIKGDVLESQNVKATKKTVMAVNSAFRQARVATKQGIKNVQKLLASAIKKSGLDAKSQSDFIGTITDIQTEEQLKAQAPKIQAKIEAKINDTRKRNAISEIRGLLKRVAKSNVIAVDYVNKITDMFSDIDVKNRSPQSLNKLQKTLDYVKSGGTVPKNVLDKLDVLGKKRLADIAPSELEDMVEAINGMIDIGKTKLKLMKAREKRILEKRLTDLASDSKPLSEIAIKRAPIGEKLAIMDRVKNKFLEGINALQRLNINKNPMDVIFDIMDGNKEYKGANHRIFKQTVDAGFQKYLDLKEATTRAVKSLQDKLNLSSEQFQKIGVYAAAQQENGVKKLLDTGITQSEIDNLSLSKEEMQMYELMRAQLDSMVPLLREIMRVHYNKNFESVENYFPFMTDFEAMNGYEIQEMFGDGVPTTAKKKNVEKGFTKSRKGGSQSIRIDALNVFMKHVDNASYLIGLGADIKQLSDLAVSPEFGAISGDVGQTIVTDWLNLLARKGSLPDRIGFVDVFRRNTGAAVLGFKLSSIFIQPTSLMDGASLVGGTYVSRGVVNVTDPTWRRFLVDNMPEIRERGGDDPAYMDLGGEGILKNAREAGYYAMQKVDLFSASSVAIGSYIKSVEERGGTVDLSKPDPVAIAEAQLYVRRTQSSGFAKDAAPVLSQGKLTGNVSVDKLILQFQSFMLNRWSLIQHDMMAAGFGSGKTVKALNIAMWLALANVSEHFIRHWSKELLALATGTEPPPEDDEEKKQQKIIMQAVGNVPFVGSIVNSFQYGSVPIPAVSMVEKISESVQYGNKSQSAQKELRHYGSAAILASGVLGVPAALQVQQIYSNFMKEDTKSAKKDDGFSSN